MKHHHKRYVAVLILAAVCLLLSCYLDVVRHGSWQGPIETPEVLLEAAEGFLRELGFALIIAWMISIGIETHARQEDGKRAESLRRLVAVDVFKGVFSYRLPRKYVDRVVELHLFPSVIRERLDLSMRLRRIDDAEASSWSIRKENFLVLEQKVAYLIRNTSTGAYRHAIRIDLPTHTGKRRQAAQVRSLRVGSNDLALNEIEAGSLSDSIENSRSYQWQVPLGPDQAVEVEIETQLLKEVSDAEVWASFLPTMAATFNFRSDVAGLRFGARSTSQVLQAQDQPPDRVSLKWTSAGPTLKGESVVFWWRANEHVDDRTDQQA